MKELSASEHILIFGKYAYFSFRAPQLFDTKVHFWLAASFSGCPDEWKASHSEWVYTRLGGAGV